MKTTKSNTENMDIEKINKIKEAIKNGTFKINANKIADKFLNEIGIEYLLKTKQEMH